MFAEPRFVVCALLCLSTLHAMNSNLDGDLAALPVRRFKRYNSFPLDYVTGSSSPFGDGGSGEIDLEEDDVEDGNGSGSGDGVEQVGLTPISSVPPSLVPITLARTHSIGATTPASVTSSTAESTDAPVAVSAATLQSMELLLANQQGILTELRSQISKISARVDEQQMVISRYDQALTDQTWKLAELTQRQAQTTSDVHLLKYAIRSQANHEHEETTSGSTSASSGSTTTPSVSKGQPMKSYVVTSLEQVKDRVANIEHVQTNLANVLQHLISEKVWTKSFNPDPSDNDNSSKLTSGADLSNTSSLVANSEKADELLTEVEAQVVEERTNQVLTSIDRWNKVEQVLHKSLSDLHSSHRHYDRELLFLANYSLNNGRLISQLGQARISDGNSILGLINSTAWLSRRLGDLRNQISENRNVSEALTSRTADSVGQLLDLIQLNSLKVTTLQEALSGQGSLFESRLNYTVSELYNLEMSLGQLHVLHNTSLRVVMEQLQSNKEKSDMLWSRFRILDNRLAHVEVRYLTEELNRYQKSNDDLRQSLKLLEMENELKTIDNNIDIQQSNHEALNSRINTLTGTVSSVGASLLEVKSEWSEFSHRLPNLENMYDEVQMMINILPHDCEDVYDRGIQKSGVQLVKLSSSHPAVKVLCEITADGDEERAAWTVIQHRSNGELNFNRNWTEYRDGFGDVNLQQDFWLGNELVHTLTSQNNYSVRFDMWTTDGGYVYAEYSHFELLSESEGYKLLVSGYSGNSTDSLRHSNNMSFSTIDVDNDVSSSHCAQFYTAGWWYKHCHYCNLNGRYTVGIVWFNHEIDEWMEMRETMIRISRRQR